MKSVLQILYTKGERFLISHRNVAVAETMKDGKGAILTNLTIDF